MINYLETPEGKNALLAINQKRWNTQVTEIFDNLFKVFCIEVNGDIEGIAEDGNQTWEKVNGLLVPTDPKLQKKYLKKGKSFFDKDDV